jgi:hypothetical protein
MNSSAYENTPLDEAGSALNGGGQAKALSD